MGLEIKSERSVSLEEGRKNGRRVIGYTHLWDAGPPGEERNVSILQAQCLCDRLGISVRQDIVRAPCGHCLALDSSYRMHAVLNHEMNVEVVE